MENYGAKIAAFRTKKNMTQAQLGKMLNVTSQAVSKWENGLSEPDLETIKKICDIFEISVNDFFETDTQKTESAATVTAQPASEPKIIYAYCEKCKKPLYSTEDYVVKREGSVQRIFCKYCEAELSEQKRVQTKRDNRASYFKGLKWACVSAAVALVLGIISIVIAPKSDIVVNIIGSVIITLGVFTSVSQIIWGNFLYDVFFFFLRSFKSPGIIFTLDLQGLVWLICVKLLLAIICFLLSVVVFIIGLFVTAIVGIVSFPFALPVAIKNAKNDKELTF